MKKILSILLVAAMLMSMLLALIPTASATGIAISDVAGLQAMASGNSYYLTQDITVPASSGLNGAWHDNYIELDGRGHTITLEAGTGDKSLFHGGGPAAHIYIKNLTMAGSVTINNATSHYAPFIRHGCDGMVTMENVTSDVDITITGTMAGAVGGLIGKIENDNGAVSLVNVTYTGNIDLSGATATVDYKSGSTTEVDETNWRRSVGGIVGGITSNKAVYMKNVTVGTSDDPTTIKVNGNSSFPSYPVGGVVGYISKQANFTLNGGSFTGGIEIAESGRRFVGGAVGSVGGNATITGFDVNATIEQKKPSAANAVDTNGRKDSVNRIGGILGAWVMEGDYSLVINDCSMSGNIKSYNEDYSGVNGIGGIVGSLNTDAANKKNATVVIANCDNSATINVTGKTGKIAGGIVGEALRIASLTLMNNTNTGNITNTCADDWTTVGGIIGTYRTSMGGSGNNEWATLAKSELIISNCQNSGALSGSKTVGGIMGTAWEFSKPDAVVKFDNCINTGAVNGATAGGLFGAATGTANGTFTGFKFNNCLNEGAVTATAGYAGGIVAAANGDGTRGGSFTVTNSANKGATTGSSDAAGIIGTAGHAVTVTGCKTTTDKITNAAATNVTTSEASVDAGAVDTYKTTIQNNISAATLGLDAESYILGRDIIVTATGGPDAKLVLYKADDLNTPIIEYGVNEGVHVTGVAHLLNEAYTEAGKGDQIPAGDYVLKLIDGLTEKESKAFTVIAMGNIAEFTGSASFAPATEDKYRAAGTLTINCSESNIPDTYTLYWGDANGKLADYDVLATITKVSKTATTYKLTDTNMLVPQGADRILIYAKRGATECTTPISAALPEGAGAADRFGEAIARFNVISDIHLTNNDNAQSNINFIKAMNDIIKNTPDTQGIFVNGDVVDWGEMVEYKALDKAIEKVEKDNNGYKLAEKMYYGLGNHDLYQLRDDGRYTGAWNANSADGKVAITRTAAQNIQQFLNGTHNETETGKQGKVYYDYWVNDMHFIFLGDEHVDTNDEPLDLTNRGNHFRSEVGAQLSTEQLDWFEETIAETKNGKEDNPVFVFLHQGIDNTVAGTLREELGQVWGGVNGEDANRIKAIMKQNPNAIMFAGHSHWALGEYKTMILSDGKLPTTFNTGAIKNQTDGTNDWAGASGYYVTVYEDKLVFTGRDFYNSKWIADAQFVIDWSDNGKIVATKTALSDDETYDPEKDDNNWKEEDKTTDPDNPPASEDTDATEPQAPNLNETDTTPAEKGGCGSVIGATGALAMIAVFGGAITVLRKKED